MMTFRGTSPTPAPGAVRQTMDDKAPVSSETLWNNRGCYRNSNGTLLEAADSQFLLCSPLNVALFLPNENISLSARIEMSACQRNSCSPEHWSVVGPDVCYAWLLSRYTCDTHEMFMLCRRICRTYLSCRLHKCSHHKWEAGRLSSALNWVAALHFALMHLQSNGEVLARCGFFLNLTH